MSLMNNTCIWTAKPNIVTKLNFSLTSISFTSAERLLNFQKRQDHAYSFKYATGSSLVG